MIKSFAGLWLMVFGPLLFLLYPSEINPIMRFNEHIEGARQSRVYQGAIHSIETRLASLPVTQWQAEVQQLASHFVFDVRLLRRSDLTLPSRKLDELDAGKVVFINAEPEYLLKPLGHDVLLLQLFTDFSEDEKIRSGAAGSIHLLKQAFNEDDESHWPELIYTLSGDFLLELRAEKRRIGCSMIKKSRTSPMIHFSGEETPVNRFHSLFP